MCLDRLQRSACAFAISVGALAGLAANQTPPAARFSVLAFYTGRNDLAHISFVQEANRWFPEIARTHDFGYESTTDWTRLNADALKAFQVVVFLDTRPDNPTQRDAFRHYMEGGGAWLGFHFSGFALTPSDYPQNWDWYHNEFLGSGPVREQHLATDVGGPARRSAGSPDRRLAYRQPSDPRPTSGIAGNTIFGRTRISGSCSQSILRVFHWGPAPSRTRSGTAATTRSSGRTRAIGWST